MTAVIPTLGSLLGELLLEVSVRSEEDGPELAREVVRPGDLIDARCEAWFHRGLREGWPLLPLDDVAMTLVPTAGKTPGSCNGFDLRLTRPDGTERKLAFSIHSLYHVASRCANQLVKEGRLDPLKTFFYKLHASTPEDRGTAPVFDDGKEIFTIERKTPPLVSLAVPLPLLEESAREAASGIPGDFPVFFTEAALVDAERVARTGASSNPPVETGGVLVGSLCSCPETKEFFVVVSEVIETVDAEESEYALYYSSRSWSRIQTVIRARQSRPETRSLRIVGQCHGHNFLPAGGAPPCEACSTTEICSRTSAFVSTDDLSWSRAVFAGQPWQLCQIFGLNARKEEVHQLFGWWDGSLVKRGYSVLPDFDPAAWPTTDE